MRSGGAHFDPHGAGLFSWALWPKTRRSKWAAAGDPPREAGKCSAAAAAVVGDADADSDVDVDGPVACSARAQLLNFC